MKTRQRPDGRDAKAYLRYRHASALHLAWSFLRRNADFQKACIAVERGERTPDEVARSYGLAAFRDFRRSYWSNGSLPKFACTSAQVLQATEDLDPAILKGKVVALFDRTELGVGKQARRLQMRSVRSQLRRILCSDPSTPNWNKQLQLTTTNAPALLQLLDLDAAGATDEEINQTLKPLVDRAVNGDAEVDKHRKRLRARARELAARCYRELAAVGAARKSAKRRKPANK